jgi:hypothetical protein
MDERTLPPFSKLLLRSWPPVRKSWLENQPHGLLCHVRSIIHLQMAGANQTWRIIYIHDSSCPDHQLSRVRGFLSTPSVETAQVGLFWLQNKSAELDQLLSNDY